MTSTQQIEWIYHERQQSALCGQHCLNNLLQGFFIDIGDLLSAAQELDAQEKKLMFEAGVHTPDAIKFAAEESGNIAADGNFSIQVLSKVLDQYKVKLIPLKRNSKIEIDTKENPTQAFAFVCNLQSHWFAIRHLYGKWWNL